MNDIKAAIIAGGKAKRLGGITKANIEITGKTIIERQLEVLSLVFDDIVVISSKTIDADLTIYADIYKDCGPLGGIHSALVNTKADYIFALSSDMPFVDVFYIELLMKHIKNEKIQAVVPIYDNKIQPLFAFYSQKALPSIVTSLKNEKFAIYEVLKNINTMYVEISSTRAQQVFFNINNQSDIEKAKEIALNLSL